MSQVENPRLVRVLILSISYSPSSSQKLLDAGQCKEINQANSMEAIIGKFASPSVVSSTITQSYVFSSVPP
jgi:hypothetical protein